jgi:hypothetical protein
MRKLGPVTVNIEEQELVTDYIKNLLDEIKYLKDRLAQQDTVNRLQDIQIKFLQQEIDKQDEIINGKS